MKLLDHESIIKPIELIYDEKKMFYVMIQEYFKGQQIFKML